MTTSSSCANFCMASTQGCSRQGKAVANQRSSWETQKYSPWNSSEGRMTLAPFAAASRTKASVFAILAAISGPYEVWMAATETVRGMTLLLMT